MKKFLSIFLAAIMLICSVPMAAYADEPQPFDIGGEDVNDGWEELDLTDEEIDEILALNTQNNIQPMATGLIVSYNIAVAHDGSTLKIVAKTIGSYEVVKAGFTKIVVQRRLGAAYSWSNYSTTNDIYRDSNSYTYAVGKTVATGYQYRATCVHYAKKNILSVQKINNTSNVTTI